MIRQSTASDFEQIYEIINNGAQAYKGVIPTEYWKEPYMSRDELRREQDDGISMWVYEEDGELVGVMGIQHRKNVTLIRHAYVCTTKQHQGIGGKLLSYLRELTAEPILIATWSNAVWAVQFYEKHGSGFFQEKRGMYCRENTGHHQKSRFTHLWFLRTRSGLISTNLGNTASS